MKSLILSMVLFASVLHAAEPLDLGVMSFNIRFANPLDGVNFWPNRKDLAVETIRESGADVIGLQEALHQQLVDLKKALPGFDWVGVGRDDGKNTGEYSAILFNAERLEVEKSGTFWLSETPDKPGVRGWDAACPRVATWGIFKDRKSGTRFFFINTHLDHQGQVAQLEGVKLIARELKELDPGLPMILTGDFNSVETSPVIREVLEQKNVPLRLAKNLASDQNFGGNSTFNGFGKAKDPQVIDFVFVSEGIEVRKYRYLVKTKDDVFVSDHWPVSASLRLPTEKKRQN